MVNCCIFVDSSTGEGIVAGLLDIPDNGGVPSVRPGHIKKGDHWQQYIITSIVNLLKIDL